MFSTRKGQWAIIADQTYNVVLLKNKLLIYNMSITPCRYYLNDVGSGSHVHLSLSDNGQNVFIGSENDPETHYGMSKVGQNFLAGVYNHLPSILAFTAPLPNR